MHFQEFWDACAQHKTPEISKKTSLNILGLLCAEQNAGNLNKMHFPNLGDSNSQNNTSSISRIALSKFLGIRFAEQNVGNLKQCNLCIDSEQSTCPSSQHSTCLATRQGRCLGSPQGLFRKKSYPRQRSCPGHVIH